ncbi:MAG: TlpA family protein disulfide reductase [candidate division NC10 bacterium]|nr:TlpA family protein disulfide reductase [candidate division NC10 bacterium]
MASSFKRMTWLLAFTIVIGLHTSLPAFADDARPEVGHFAPDFALCDTDPKLIRLSDYRGKVVLLNFWATWCPPCRLEMPTMEQVYREYKRRGLEVLAVSLDTGHAAVVAVQVAEFMKELKLTFPALLDPKMEVARRYRLVGLPTSFLIDRQGRIRFKEVGFRSWTDPDSRKKLEALLR